ncbi:MAG: peptidylprolyl isomerase [Lachnospiraceae bacterium]|nr:peptidylprolyl isomerase [Lachnospiraceae bacterium]
MKKKIIIGACIFAMIALIVSSVIFIMQKREGRPEIVFTKDFAQNEVFRINSKSCFVPEISIYMKTAEDQYTNIYGEEIWDQRIKGETLEDRLKSTMLARVAQIKSMNLLAESMEISLEDSEIELSQRAGKEYVDELSDKAESLGVNQGLVSKMYEEYALADKVYKKITDQVNPEISDDEARSITVRQIVLFKGEEAEDGSFAPYDEAKQKAIKQKAEDVLSIIRDSNGESFEDCVDKYSESDQETLSFSKGEMPQSLEEIAFNMSNGDISDVIETEDSYIIIQILSTFDKAATDENKVRILRQRKKEAFDKVYNEFSAALMSELNVKLWESLNFRGESLNTDKNFFEVYEQVFKN